MNYKYEIRKKAIKFIRKQERSQQILILRALYLLPQGNVKKIQDFIDFYRLCADNYRIIFEMNQKTNTITVVAIDFDNTSNYVYR